MQNPDSLSEKKCESASREYWLHSFQPSTDVATEHQQEIPSLIGGEHVMFVPSFVHVAATDFAQNVDVRVEVSVPS